MSCKFKRKCENYTKSSITCNEDGYYYGCGILPGCYRKKLENEE
jgi:hypothetical protein